MNKGAWHLPKYVNPIEVLPSLANFGMLIHDE